MRQSLRTLLAAAIDYAGLFPPAKLDMATSMRCFGGSLAGPFGWALGRFVIPVTGVEDFNFHIGELGFDGRHGRLRLSAVVGDRLEADLEKVRQFNRWHAERDGGAKAIIDAIEVKAAFSETVARVIESAHGGPRLFFEIPIGQDPGDLVSAIARAGGAAKVRTGGPSPGVFPAVKNLVRFLEACLGAGVPFKATGGLQHPLSGIRPVVAGRNAPEVMTYGFLNLLLCAAFVYDGSGPDAAAAVLKEDAAEAFIFDDEGVTWRDKRLTVDTLGAVRRDFALSFGSASFDEPMKQLSGLGGA